MDEDESNRDIEELLKMHRLTFDGFPKKIGMPHHGLNTQETGRTTKNGNNDPITDNYEGVKVREDLPQK